MNRTLVICIGNEYVADDAVGFAVYQAMCRTRLDTSTRLVHLGLAGLELLEELDGEDLCVVVDAANQGDIPGTLRLCSIESARANAQATCSHDIGVFDAFAIGRQLMPRRMPREALLVTVEGERFDLLGAPMTSDVASAIPGAISLVLDLLTSEDTADVAKARRFEA